MNVLYVFFLWYDFAIKCRYSWPKHGYKTKKFLELVYLILASSTGHRLLKKQFFYSHSFLFVIMIYDMDIIKHLKQDNHYVGLTLCTVIPLETKVVLLN